MEYIYYKQIYLGEYAATVYPTPTTPATPLFANSLAFLNEVLQVSEVVYCDSFQHWFSYSVLLGSIVHCCSHPVGYVYIFLVGLPKSSCLYHMDLNSLLIIQNHNQIYELCHILFWFLFRLLPCSEIERGRGREGG